MAAGRAAFYGVFVEILDLLPDKFLLSKIRGGEFQGLLKRYAALGEHSFAHGFDLIVSYRTGIKERADEDVLRDLAVDRTRILRGTGPDIKPPYEGLYKKQSVFENSVLGVKRFYRRAGIVPHETVSESVDYLCVELDFMRQLCLREEKLRSQGEPADAVIGVIRLEEEFLRVHPGSWVSEFCDAVEKHASTDFFRGVALILRAYILSEKKWLESAMRKSSAS